MRKIFQLFAIILALSGFSLASPAQDLFDQASFYLEFYYNGPATVTLKEFTASYQASLDQACAAAKDTCAFDKAVPVINQMVSALRDGHTYYQTPEDLGRFEQSQTGNAPSPKPRIGIEHRDIPGSRDRLITDVVEDSPADQAGLQYGDRIIGLNGKIFAELPSNEDISKLLTDTVQAGNPLMLTIVRGPERKRLEITLTGRQINESRLPSLKIRPDGIAVLRIPDFLAQGQVGSRVHTLVREAQARGAKAMILDLRGNSGGSAFESLVSMAAFVDKPYILFNDRYKVESDEYVVENGRATILDKNKVRRLSVPIPNLTRWQGPLVVLVDNQSASGAEYLASAIQLAGTGVVIGEPTVGIGNTTTRTFDLINGGGINISYNRAFLANGDPYPAQVKPNTEIANSVEVLANQGRDLPFEKALETLSGKATN